jgi:hypothetical protein
MLLKSYVKYTFPTLYCFLLYLAWRKVRNKNMNYTGYLQPYDERMDIISVWQTEGEGDDGIL